MIEGVSKGTGIVQGLQAKKNPLQGAGLNPYQRRRHGGDSYSVDGNQLSIQLSLLICDICFKNIMFLNISRSST